MNFFEISSGVETFENERESSALFGRKKMTFKFRFKRYLLILIEASVILINQSKENQADLESVRKKEKNSECSNPFVNPHWWPNVRWPSKRSSSSLVLLSECANYLGRGGVLLEWPRGTGVVSGDGIYSPALCTTDFGFDSRTRSHRFGSVLMTAHSVLINQSKENQGDLESVRKKRKEFERSNPLSTPLGPKHEIGLENFFFISA
ncbi:hypothetical protein CEXT_479451 [Caerostris extrusa]|uniref:Uncharacterized protein n=1 Tax=Caerostris extrusa TaxID=172846 RepID=A0AAV4MJJ8_CAEEX|nr:hypothetical protein CEXT_479451 [Caerostris extrusa]